MDIRVSGHQIATGTALQTHVTDRLHAIADKYFARAISSHVTFGRGPHGSLACDIVAHVMQGVLLKGRGQAQDAHVAFEGAAERIEYDARTDKLFLRISRKHHGNVRSSIITADRITEPGFTLSMPAYLGTVPWVASNIAALSPMFAPGAMPTPPTSAATASDR